MKQNRNKNNKPGGAKPAVHTRHKNSLKTDIMKTLVVSGEGGMSAQELLAALKVRGLKPAWLFKNLTELIKDKRVLLQKGKYRLTNQPKTAEAVVVRVNEGYAFARPEGADADIFIPGRFLMGAMPGDRVLVRVKKGRGDLLEGEVLKVFGEKGYTFTGTFKWENGVAYIYPGKKMSGPVMVLPGEEGGAQDGEKVAATLKKRGQNHYSHRAGVTAVFGPGDSAAVCAKALIADSGIPTDFTEEELQEAGKIAARTIDEADIAARRDLRDEIIFTIDGADTKDIDDAVSLTKTNGGYRLGVHIADVSEYVKPGQILDEGAYARGTSVYYANEVIPMLPKALSNGICSLNPEEDRLAFSVFVDLDENGQMKDYRFEKTVVRSRLKGVYEEINRIFGHTADEALMAKYAPVLLQLESMHALCSVLEKRRSERGALELESVETKITIGPDGVTAAIAPRTRGKAEEMIEEFMLVANEAAASFGQDRAIPFLYRVHEDPSSEKLEQLAELLTVLGLDASEVKTGVQPGQLAKILQNAKENDAAMLVNRQLLRAMAKAKYSHENLGHFGLVLAKYSHFTSPIRRYPDLVIHRIMSECLAGAGKAEVVNTYGEFVKAAATQSSTTEQKAANIERDCEDFYMAEYMKKHLGEEFDGIISGMSDRGMFVALENTAEGMVRTAGMDGAYEYDGKILMNDKHTGKSYRVGDKVRIQVTRADVAAGEVDFILV